MCGERFVRVWSSLGLKETGLRFPRSAGVCERYDVQESRKYVADENASVTLCIITVFILLSPLSHNSASWFLSCSARSFAFFLTQNFGRRGRRGTCICVTTNSAGCDARSQPVVTHFLHFSEIPSPPQSIYPKKRSAPSSNKGSLMLKRTGSSLRPVWRLLLVLQSNWW